MAQKKKTTTRKKVVSKKVGSSKRSISTRNLLIFAVIFALIGGYAIWRSYAADAIVYDYTTVNRTESHGEDPLVNDAQRGKSNTSVYTMIPYMKVDGSGQQDGIIVMSKSGVPQGVYNACVIGVVVDGTPDKAGTAMTSVFAAKHSLSGANIASKTFTPAISSKYEKLACISVTHDTNDPLIFTTSDKTLGTRMNIGSVILTKTGGTTTPPPPPPTTGDQPAGVPGSWKLAFSDEFNGTSLDLNKWDPNWFNEGGSMNGVGTYASNVKVGGGVATLTLASSGKGALFNTQSNNGYTVKPGQYAESRVYFSGNGSSIYNWGAWWLSGPNWPSTGEHDIAEVLGGKLTVNYHSPSGSHNQGAPSGYWGDAFHVYGVRRNSKSADVYWDGKLVKSYATDDNGGGENLIFNIGTGSSPTMYGTAGQMKVDWVRVWSPS